MGEWRIHLRFGENPRDPQALYAVTNGASYPKGAYLRAEAESICRERNAQPSIPTERYLADHFEWAAPGDQQEDVWLLRFCDDDVRDMMWTGPEAEAEAWAAWNRHAPGYNCYLFRLARLGASS